MMSDLIIIIIIIIIKPNNNSVDTSQVNSYRLKANLQFLSSNI